MMSLKSEGSSEKARMYGTDCLLLSRLMYGGGYMWVWISTTGHCGSVDSSLLAIASSRLMNYGEQDEEK
jgi:hypothetical protein